LTPVTFGSDRAGLLLFLDRLFDLLRVDDFDFAMNSVCQSRPSAITSRTSAAPHGMPAAEIKSGPPGGAALMIIGAQRVFSNRKREPVWGIKKPQGDKMPCGHKDNR
jgi:hypothetical protein